MPAGGSELSGGSITTSGEPLWCTPSTDPPAWLHEAFEAGHVLHSSQHLWSLRPGRRCTSTGAAAATPCNQAVHVLTEQAWVC